MQSHIDRPSVVVLAALIFYFILNQEYHVAWIPILAAIWIYGVRSDFLSTFERLELLKYEANPLLVGCIQRFGIRRAVMIGAACETAFILFVSVLIARPVGLNVADFAFVAGVMGVYHLYCAKSNYAFKPK